MDATMLAKASPESRRYGGHSKRLALLAMAGAISGFLVGVGAQIVLTQGGHINNLDVLSGWPQLFGIAIGIAWALVRLPTRYKKWEKLFTIGLALVALVLALFILAPPASAQDHCDVLVSIGNGTSSLTGTTRDAPLRINLETTREIRFSTSADGIRDGIVEVVVASVTPSNLRVERNGTVVYYDSVSGGASSNELSIERTGPTGFVATAPGFKSPIMPLGLIELLIIVKDDVSSGEPRTVCSNTAWIHPVARPATNPIGLLGTAACAVGLAGIGVVRTGRLRLDRSSEDQLSGDASQPAPTVTVTPDEGSSEITIDDRRSITAIRVGVSPGATTTTLTEDNPS